MSDTIYVHEHEAPAKPSRRDFLRGAAIGLGVAGGGGALDAGQSDSGGVSPEVQISAQME